MKVLILSAFSRKMYTDSQRRQNQIYYLENRERLLELSKLRAATKYVARDEMSAEELEAKREYDRIWYHLNRKKPTCLKPKVPPAPKPLKPIKEKKVSKRRLPRPYIIYEKEELPSDTFGIKHMRHDQKQKLLDTCPLGFVDLTTAVPSFTCKFE